MAKIKIKTETFPERCEICHKADLFNRETNYCSRCVVTIINNSKEEQHQRTWIPKPHNVTVVNKNVSLEIVIPYFSGTDLAGSGTFLVFSIISVTQGFKFAIIIAIVFAYMFLITLFNKRLLRVSNKELFIHHGIVPTGNNIKVNSDDIEQIYCEKGIMEGYKLKALLKNGTVIELFCDLTSSNVALYLEQQIEKYLNITDKPIFGELTKEFNISDDN